MTRAVFEPTALMRRYLATLKRLIAAGRPMSQLAIARCAGMSVSTLSRWRRLPHFEEWVSAELPRLPGEPAGSSMGGRMAQERLEEELRSNREACGLEEFDV